MSEVTVEERLVALEKNVEWLIEGYKDIAWTHLDNLVKRIETIRDEVNASIRGVEERVYTEAFGKIAEAVEEARQKLSHEVIANSVIPELTSGRHVLVTRPASFEEQRSGKGIPVRQAPHKG
jgi:hypothetical protein